MISSTDSQLHIGLDLGGTKTEVIALDSHGNQKFRKRVPTPSNDYLSIIKTIVELVICVEKELGKTGTVGVGTPGAISPASGLIKNSNTVCLIGKPIKLDLERALCRPIRLANDADCFTISEAIDGAGAFDKVVFGVIVGTGTGGGIVVNKELISGPNSISGEWGHNPLPWQNSSERPGYQCYCGKYGCIETFLSGPGLARDHEYMTGNRLTAVEIARLDEEGDKEVNATLIRYEDRFARSLAGVINILDPDIVVLGGGLSNLNRLYDSVPQLLHHYVFSDRVDTKIVRAVHGDSSGVRGAAWLWSPE